MTYLQIKSATETSDGIEITGQYGNYLLDAAEVKKVVKFYLQYPALKWLPRWNLKQNWHILASKLAGLWWDFPKINGKDKRNLKVVLEEARVNNMVKKFEIKVSGAKDRDAIEEAANKIITSWREAKKVRKTEVNLHKVNEEKDNPDEVTIILSFADGSKDKAWEIKAELADELKKLDLIGKITSAGHMD
jgi:hypothetical protein